MKKVISLILVLVLCLSLASCGKETTLKDLTGCPRAPLQETEKFLKKAGVEITSVTDEYVAFNYGNWRGTVSATGISLDISDITAKGAFDQEVEAMQKEVDALCGEPYASNDSAGLPGMEMSSITAFYRYDGGIIATSTFNSSFGKNFTVGIYPGAGE